MGNVTLPIKKEFFDKIRLGEKKVEYRNYSSFFIRRFNKNIKTLTLHYYQSQKIIVRIEKISVVETPSFLKSNLLFGSKVFKIELGSILNANDYLAE